MRGDLWDCFLDLLCLPGEVWALEPWLFLGGWFLDASLERLSLELVLALDGWLGLDWEAVWASSDEGLAPLVKPKLSREFGMVSLLMMASIGEVEGPVSLS